MKSFFLYKFLKTVFAILKNRKASISILSYVSPKSTFGDYSTIKKYVEFSGSIGSGSYIDSNTRLSAHIGKFTSIASNVDYVDATHPYTTPFVSTSPCFYSKNNSSVHRSLLFADNDYFEEFRHVDKKNRVAVSIGNDCWIGTGAFLIGGITISDGAIVLAHSVVTKDVPPYAIVGGVPARIISYRYDEDTIKKLIEVAWWNKPLKEIVQNASLFRNIDLFLKKERDGK